MKSMGRDRAERPIAPSTTQVHPSATGYVCPNVDPTPSKWAATALPFRLDKLQTEILNSQAKRLLLCCSRQWGKSTVIAAKALHLGLAKPGASIIMTSASLHQAVELLDKIEHFAAAGSHRKAAILTLANGSVFRALPQAPKTVRGRTADLLIIDEAAFVSDELFEAVTPSIATTGGALWLLSTADDCPRISKDYLAAEKIIRGERKFRQEFYCEFQTGCLQFTGRQVIDAAYDHAFNERRIQLDYADYED